MQHVLGPHVACLRTFGCGAACVTLSLQPKRGLFLASDLPVCSAIEVSWNGSLSDPLTGLLHNDVPVARTCAHTVDDHQRLGVVHSFISCTTQLC
jgi:hypothetical protein